MMSVLIMGSLVILRGAPTPPAPARAASQARDPQGLKALHRDAGQSRPRFERLARRQPFWPSGVGVEWETLADERGVHCFKVSNPNSHVMWSQDSELPGS